MNCGWTAAGVLQSGQLYSSLVPLGPRELAEEMEISMLTR